MILLLHKAIDPSMVWNIIITFEKHLLGSKILRTSPANLFLTDSRLFFLKDANVHS